MSKNIETLDYIINYRPPHYNKEFPLILFWRNKSGCSTLVKWFFFQIGILEEARKYARNVHKYEFKVYK
jgi:hypothetical protein